MSLAGGFSRTRVLMKGERTIPMAMSKWWGKKRPAEAEITMHVSNHLLHPVAPWIKTWPKKLVARVPVWAWPISTMALTMAVVVASDKADAQEQYDHRY